jgi:hypothetical protein
MSSRRVKLAIIALVTIMVQQDSGASDNPQQDPASPPAVPTPTPTPTAKQSQMSSDEAIVNVAECTRRIAELIVYMAEQLQRSIGDILNIFKDNILVRYPDGRVEMLSKEQIEAINEQIKAIRNKSSSVTFEQLDSETRMLYLRLAMNR